ncbi:cysteine desulfurase-like protein [Streptomyces sp. NPDC093085]|uniref:cysteine desulfurase-like protein n=1 Tax=Streptomyces sp. NPDC093085 TaxID=3155068 RepID=UPI00343CD2CB
MNTDTRPTPDDTPETAPDDTPHTTPDTAPDTAPETAPDTVAFDIAAVRAVYPALRDGTAYLDGAAGTQTPEPVIEAIAAAYRAGIGNVGGAFPASERAGALVDGCRRALADLVGGEPEGVVLGANTTTLIYRFAGILAATWRPGDEVVLSRLDHDANVRPWVQAAERAGAVVRWAEVDPDSGELPAGQYDALLGARTRLVAVTAASNILGTRPDVAAITAKAHAAGALTYVDGVHATPHGPVDARALGADFYATSAYKWSGPHLGAVVADPALLASLRPEKLACSPETVPHRFETGTLPFGDLAGVTAAVDHLAGLGGSGAPSGEIPGERGAHGAHGARVPRRARLLASMAAVERYERELFGTLLDGLRALPRVTLYGAPARRTATAYFRVAGHPPAAVAGHLARRGVNVWSGHNYAWELTGSLGLRDTGGAVRAGLVHYNDEEDVARFLAGVAELAG